MRALLFLKERRRTWRLRSWLPPFNAHWSGLSFPSDLFFRWWILWARLGVPLARAFRGSFYVFSLPLLSCISVSGRSPPHIPELFRSSGARCDPFPRIDRQGLITVILSRSAPSPDAWSTFRVLFTLGRFPSSSQLLSKGVRQFAAQTC